MFYEEKLINGVLHCRSRPNTEWRPKVFPTTAEPEWTDEDDKNLAALLDRKAKSEQTKYAAVHRIVQRFPSWDMTSDEITDQLIEHATAVRAALKPYDKEAS